MYEAGVGGDATEAEDSAAVQSGNDEIGAHSKRCGPQTCDAKGRALHTFVLQLDFTPFVPET